MAWRWEHDFDKCFYVGFFFLDQDPGMDTGKTHRLFWRCRWNTEIHILFVVCVVGGLGGGKG